MSYNKSTQSLDGGKTMTALQRNTAAPLNFDEHNIATRAMLPAVQLFGSPGSGKTALIDATIRTLWTRARVGVIVAHLAAQRDATTLRAAGAVTMPLET